MSQLGLTINGKPLTNTNPNIQEFVGASPSTVVKVAANSGDRELDKKAVQYAKATIQAGKGPFSDRLDVMKPFPSYLKDAIASLEASPQWAPFVKVSDSIPGYDKWINDDPSGSVPGHMWQCPNCGEGNYREDDQCSNCGHDRPIHERPQEFDSKVKVADTTSKIRDAFIKEAPGKEHMKGVSPKRNRQYEHIKDSLLESGKSEEEAKEEAARTVNKQRAEKGETKGSKWVEADMLTQYRTQRGDFGSTPGQTGEEICPKCGTVNPPGSAQCLKCGSPLAQGQTGVGSQGGPSNAYSQPLTANVSSMKWHLADLNELPQPQPDTIDGQFNDHRDVGEMSQGQAEGHQRLVNIVVDEMNKAISQGGTVDATLIQNLVQWLVDKFGQDADSAQAIVDAATKQARTSDGRLDGPEVPDPADQVPQPTQGDVISDPAQTQNNGAFQSHVRTPSGRVGTIIERWKDMYDEKWAMVADGNGFKESVYEDELLPAEAPEGTSTVEELKAFAASFEPVEATQASIKARIANVKILRDEIRFHMANSNLSLEQRFALDQMDADASVELLNLTDSFAPLTEREQSYLDSQRGYEPQVGDNSGFEHGGMDYLDVPESDPEWSNEALEAFTPEEAEVLVSELPTAVRSDSSELAAVATAHIDRMTSGHSSEARAHHRKRFVEAALRYAEDYKVEEPEAEEEQDWDGPVEQLFDGGSGWTGRVSR